MHVKIKDGTGSGSLSGVRGNRLFTSARALSFSAHSSINNLEFMTFTGVRTFTSSGEHGMMYLKCIDPNYYLLLNQIRVYFGRSGVTSPLHTIRIYKNPTGGTLFNSNYTGTPSSLNFAYQPVYGFDKLPFQCISTNAGAQTITGGPVMMETIATDPKDYVLDCPISLPNNSSFALSVVLDSSVTSITCSVTFQFSALDPNSV